jgi:HEPN domain-containing protein
VNHQLERGRYFFVDIVRDGILLHNLPGHPLAAPAELSPGTALEEAEGFLSQWFESGRNFEKLGNMARDPMPKEAAFLLHQATEHFYNCVLLVLTLYTPKSHNLVRLRNLAEPLDPRLKTVWSMGTKFEKRCFELLRAAYIKARYSRHYKIMPEELNWLSERVSELGATVETICKERIAALEVRVAAE